jgi:hypothetical protein
MSNVDFVWGKLKLNFVHLSTPHILHCLPSLCIIFNNHHNININKEKGSLRVVSNKTRIIFNNHYNINKEKEACVLYQTKDQREKYKLAYFSLNSLKESNV